MNVTASKLLLVVSLAAFTWVCWPHLMTSRAERVSAEEKKSKGITSEMVDRKVALALVADPFGTTPLDRGAVAVAVAGAGAGAVAGAGAAGGILPNDPAKQLGDLTLQGVFISFGRRVAVSNGKTMHEGEIVESAPGGPMIRAKQIGQDHVIIEGGGGVQLLRLADANRPAEPPAKPGAPAQARGAGRSVASVHTEER
jgi:hypothetical protein